VRALQVTRLAGPAGVEIADVPDPTPGPDQVLIDVHAVGLGFPDLLLSRGDYQMRPQLPFVLGTDVAGVVRRTPPGAGLSVGDRVAAFTWIGGAAEIVAVSPDMALKLPDNVSLRTAAAVPMNYLTVHFALRHRGNLRAGETVLVQGAGGGIGTAAIALAKALGATVFAVVSSAEKAAIARQAGADHVLAADAFRQELTDITGGKGIDVVVDPVGGDRVIDSLRTLDPDGRLLVIGFTSGEIPTVKVNRLLLNNISVIGVAWSEYAVAHPGFVQRQWADLAPYLASGAIQPPLAPPYSLEEAETALADLAARRLVGKVVLDLRRQRSL
jgi:NADPH2:quinone reductase